MTKPRKWTNASVLTLGALDPVKAITEKARGIVARALDAGWTGPPYDPLVLADILHLAVTPSDDVRDARTLGAGDGKHFRIEFNPNRPKARVRFSLAHEIAHTLFADCRDHVRNRAAYHEMTPDGWQLEALCNIAAAEFLMPAGSLPDIGGDAIRTELLVELRQRYDVSMEALLLRLTRLSTSPCAMFCASTPTPRLASEPYSLQVDYAVCSASWAVTPVQGMLLPTTSVLSECDSVGFTASRKEKWPAFGEVNVECVAIPPYPGGVRPRVVGLLLPTDNASSQTPATWFRVVRGDVTRPRGTGEKIIAHVVNDATPNWGGSGVSSAIRSRFPSAQQAFREWNSSDPSNLRLGGVHFVQVAADTMVASLIAQKGYGPSVRPRIRYSALYDSLLALSSFAKQRDATVHIPRIGAGQARGDWDVVEGLVREHLCARGVRVTVYDLPGTAAPVSEQPSLSL